MACLVAALRKAECGKPAWCNHTTKVWRTWSSCRGAHVRPKHVSASLWGAEALGQAFFPLVGSRRYVCWHASAALAAYASQHGVPRSAGRHKHHQTFAMWRRNESFVFPPSSFVLDALTCCYSCTRTSDSTSVDHYIWATLGSWQTAQSARQDLSPTCSPSFLRRALVFAVCGHAVTCQTSDISRIEISVG